MSEEAGKPRAVPHRPDPATTREDAPETRKRILVVLAALLAPVLVVLLVFWGGRPPAVTGGSIERVAVVEQQSGEYVLVVVHLTLQNHGRGALRLWNFTARLRTPDGEWTDEAASAVDHERYFTAYPELREHAIPPLLPEAAVPAGARHSGLLIFGFPLSREAFARRESFTVTVDMHDRPPIVVREATAS
jgi:hypothetical protein